jgi:predicted TIM-barrel fold metal-dependent hydrolase
MKRRAFLGTTALAASALPAAFADEDHFIDTNVYLDEWPFRELSFSGVNSLSASLKKAGVTEAWAGSFKAIGNANPDTINNDLAEQCKGSLFQPVAAINPMLSKWAQTISRAVDLGFHGIRLHPNYHDFQLDDPKFTELLTSTVENQLAVQIVVRLEDPRTQPANTSVPDVDLKPLLTSLRQVPEAKVQILSGLRSSRDSLTLSRLGELGVTFDIAMLEGIEGLRQHFDRFPGLPIAFGSHAPFFYAQSSALKLQESELTQAEIEAVKFQTAHTLRSTK